MAAIDASDLSEKRRILVVEDNIDAAEFFKLSLQVWGYNVSVAHNGKQALKTFDEGFFDFVFLDIGLPDMDGYEVARNMLNAQNKSRPGKLVALTGRGEEDEQQKAKDFGFDEYLLKPVDLKMLKSFFNKERNY